MEFGTLGLGTQPPATNTQTAGANPARSATLETNPENVVTPTTQNDAAENDLRRDRAEQNESGAVAAEPQPAVAADEPATSRRTTLNFDSEQNRIFLEIVDTATDEVVERIPSDEFVALVDEAVTPPRDIAAPEPEEEADSVPLPRGIGS